MAAQLYPYKNLIFEGGGVKGLAYVGALEVLEAAGITRQTVRVGGASAGAITATMVSLGYTAAEIRKIMFDLDFTRFEDGGWGGLCRLFKKFGWYKGAYFLNFMEEKIADKTGGNRRATFAELRGKFKDLYVVGTDLTTQRSVVFSHENPESRDMAVADAVRISMSIPLFFASRRADQNVWCDGGVLNNYPIDLFDQPAFLPQPNADPDDYTNPETLGFHLDNLKSPVSHRIQDLKEFVGSVYEALVNIQNDLLMSNPQDCARSVFIDNLGIKTTDFSLTEAQKKALAESGRCATLKFLKLPAPGCESYPPPPPCV